CGKYYKWAYQFSHWIYKHVHRKTQVETIDRELKAVLPPISMEEQKAIEGATDSLVGSQLLAHAMGSLHNQPIATPLRFTQNMTFALQNPSLRKASVAVKVLHEDTANLGSSLYSATCCPL
uniref:Uncharacterized protein n=1 Tax=Chrysemys picta bellii TaxID=8478 RepID=A0A8C3HSV6_CHRPI